MTFTGLRFVDEDAAAPAAPQAAVGEPKVFARTITAPPGMPWEQRRSADLEARHGAPLPISEVLLQVRRLDIWRPGAPARFAAFYVVAAEVSGRVRSDVEIDGRVMPVTFVSAAERGRQARTVGMVGAVAAVLAFVCMVAVGMVFVRRADADAALSAAEVRAGRTTTLLQKAEAIKAEARALNARSDRGAPMDKVLADIDWAASAKNPDAHIEALHWAPGLIAVQVRGQQPPFQPSSERVVERAAKPVRGGVWLWGAVERSSDAGRQMAAMAHEPARTPRR